MLCMQLLTGGCKAVCFRHSRYRICKQALEADGEADDACTQIQVA